MPPTGDVAIIGMACIFPGAPDLETYWQNIVNKVDALTDPPPETWDAEIFFDPDSSENNRVYCRRGGYLGPLAVFNPLAYGIMPAGLDGGEPDQWLALKVAHDALVDARYLERLRQNRTERHRTAVILGKGTYLNRGNLNMVQHSLIVDQTLQLLQTLHPEYSQADLDLLRQELREKLPPFNAEAAPGLVPNIVAGRVANRLDLMGPTYTIDAACASSLLALEAAGRELLAGRCDLALAGGVQVTTPIPILTLFCQLNALSRQQQIRPFDKKADGTILGEGLGIVLLKRAEEAARDGDRIYALLKGAGIASDGRGMGVLAPRIEGAALALRRAYESTGLAPETIGLIEAHGTGTAAGDQMELQVLEQLFKPRTGRPPTCAIGSVKSMIGHTMPAAGIAGVIKTALALYHKVLPPTLHCDEPNPALDREKSACYINTETRPWIHGAPAGAAPRRAGVNAFGFGGINAHLILEEQPDPDEGQAPTCLRQWENEVLILESESRQGLTARVRQVETFLKNNPEIKLLDLAYTTNAELSEQPYRLALVAASVEELRQKLAKAATRLAEPDCHHIKDARGIYFFETPLYPAGNLAFLFPGEGSQYPNMLADLCFHFPEVRACFDRIDRLFVDHPRRYLPSDVIFPRPTFGERSQQAQQIWQTDVAVEAVLTANQALFTLLDRLGIRPQAMAGHSTGEYSALRASGIIPLSDEAFVEDHLLDLNRLYTDQVAQKTDVPRAVLVAVGAGLDRVSTIIEQVDGRIYVGMENCPHQTVIVGEQPAMTAAIDLMRDQGLIFERLPFDRAYHTPLFGPYSQRLHQFFEPLPLTRSKLPLYSCTTAAPYPDKVTQIRVLALEHWVKPVRFRETIEAMYADGIRLFVEVGASGNLTAFVDDILRGQPHLAIPANRQHRSGLSQLNHLLALLGAQGVPLQLDYLYQRRNPQTLSLENRGDPPKKAGTIKLATGWAGMEISAEVAGRLGQRHTAQFAPAEPASAATDAGPVAQPAVSPGSAREQPADQKNGRDRPHQPVSSDNQANPDLRTGAMQTHLQLMEQFLTTQQEIMQQFLAKEPGLAFTPSMEAFDTVGSDLSPIDETPAPAAAEISRPPSDPTRSEPPSADLASEAIETALLQLISEKTGYPPDMLHLSANLEADLGIDSIKRVEILGLFNQETGLLSPQDMEQISNLPTLQAIIDFFANSPDRPSAQSTPPDPAGSYPAIAQPFIRKILSLVPGQELVARCQLDLAEDLFLKDHTLGRSISADDPNLLALPIVPLTISMEILAEAAAYLLPDQTVIGMRAVRAHRWILLEAGKIALQVVARRRPAPNDREVEVFLREAGTEEPAGPAAPIVEGIVLFGTGSAEPDPASPKPLSVEQPSTWTPQQLYTDGMFHGPAFQAVASIDRSGPAGLIATLQTLPTDRLFRSRPDPTFVAEPIILDAAGQLVGFWTMEHLESGFVVFPFRLEALQLYGSPLSAPDQARCQARINLIEGNRVRSQIEITGPDGRLRARLIDWEDKRFEVPRPFYRFLLSPRNTVLAEAWTAPLDGIRAATAVQCCRVAGFPAGFFEAHGQFWARVLAHLVLSQSERQIWQQMKGPARRRIEWLLGRVAAKDAVRRLVNQSEGITLYPADVEIGADNLGRPVVQGGLGRAIAVSISHTDGLAVALAGQYDDGQEPGFGIDVERIKPQDPGFEKTAFTPAERTLLARLRPDDEVWPLRLWCAKEAVGKALGQGLAGGPLSVVATKIDGQTGLVHVKLAGEMARRLPEFQDTPITVYTVRDKNFIVASTLGLK